MKMFGRSPRTPANLGKPFRWISDWFLFVVHVINEVVPNVVHRFHVVAALLHKRIAAVPAEAHQADPALYPQARRFQPLSALFHGAAGADRDLKQADGRRW